MNLDNSTWLATSRHLIQLRNLVSIRKYSLSFPKQAISIFFYNLVHFVTTPKYRSFH